jgi:hypothetical protein
VTGPEGWAGYRGHRRNPLAGDLVVTVEARAQGIDVGTRWATICNAHGELVGEL